MTLSMKPEVGWMVAFVTLFAVLIFVIVAFILAFPKCPSMLWYVVNVDSNNNVTYLSAAPSSSSTTPGYGTSLILAQPPSTTSPQQVQLAQTWFFRLTGTATGQYYMYNVLAAMLISTGPSQSGGIIPVLANAKSSLRNAITVAPDSSSNAAPGAFVITTQINGIINYLAPSGNGQVAWVTSNPQTTWLLIPNQTDGNLSL